MTATWDIEIMNAAPELLAELHAGCFEQPWNANAFANLLRTPGTVATIARGDGDNGTPAGFALLRLAGGEAEIVTIGVRPACRGRGAGAALLDDLTTRARAAGASALLLEVAVDNTAAIALYQGRGFASHGRRARYYRRPGGAVDAIIMRQALV